MTNERRLPVRASCFVIHWSFWFGHSDFSRHSCFGHSGFSAYWLLPSAYFRLSTSAQQKAHEVTRDVTAWALLWPRTDFVRQPAPGLGPPRSAQPDPVSFDAGSDRRLIATFRGRDRSPNGVA